MRKPLLLLLLLAFVSLPRAASADPLVITGGEFLLDIEGDMFTFNGSDFNLTTSSIGIYSTKLFPGRCDPSGWPLGFCAEAEGAIVDWSFHTVGGDQLLGTGDAVIDGVNASGVDFLGSMQFSVAPTPLSSGGTEDFDFVAPFTFEATIRGVQGGNELFARQFTGRGRVRANYEATLQPGVFSVHDDTVDYTFEAAPVPEPGTLLLLGSGLAGVVLRRRRQS